MSNNHFIVGLGGTGGKVIRELLKAIERNKDPKGEVPSDARFEFAYLDTSEGLLHETDQWMVLGKDVSLARPQRGIYAASGVRPVLNDPQSFPGMRDWIEPRRVFDFIDAEHKFRLGAHHGVALFGLIQMLGSLPDLVEGLDRSFEVIDQRGENKAE